MNAAEAHVRQGVEHCRLDQAGSIRICAPYLIQLSPDNDTNINFWGHPKLMPVCNTGIHNHYVSFESEIVLGAITNIKYRVTDDPAGPFDRFLVKRWRDLDNQLQYAMEPGTPRAQVEAVSADIWRVGERYALNATDYHSNSITEPTLTLMHIDRTPENPEVFFFPVGEKEYATTFDKRTPRDEAALNEAWNRIDAFLALIPQ